MRLTPPAERAALHLIIARRLLAGLSRAALDEAVFQVADQYNRGIAGVTAGMNGCEVAALNLLAGRRARDAAAFAAALGYFEHGWQLLGEAGWADVERLCFDLRYHIAECRFLTGNSSWPRRSSRRLRRARQAASTGPRSRRCGSRSTPRSTAATSPSRPASSS